METLAGELTLELDEVLALEGFQLTQVLLLLVSVQVSPLDILVVKVKQRTKLGSAQVVCVMTHVHLKGTWVNRTNLSKLTFKIWVETNILLHIGHF